MSSLEDQLNDLRAVAVKPLRILGPTKISGSVGVQGSKNAANKLLAATVALPWRYSISNFPIILDALEMLLIIERLGGNVKLDSDLNVANIDTTRIINQELPYELTRSTTGAFGFAGALLGRFGRVEIGKPGGDQIGPRPVDLHIEGLRSLGANIEERSESIKGVMQNTPLSSRHKLNMPSTGAAVNYILAIVGSGGGGVLENSPIDSDMETMYALLRLRGVVVEVAGGEVKIDATTLKTSESVISFACCPDRNDAFTWLAYGAVSSAGLKINNINLKDVQPGIDALIALGVRIKPEDDGGILVKAPESSSRSSPISTVVAGLAGEFHSDWAPLLEVVLTTLSGNWRVIDTLFSHRVRQAELLQLMGADINISGGAPPRGIKLHFGCNPNQARYIVDVRGPCKLHAVSTDVGYDVRACAAVVMAATQADGASVLSGAEAFFRGYEKIVDRLKAVGVNIQSGEI